MTLEDLRIGMVLREEIGGNENRWVVYTVTNIHLGQVSGVVLVSYAPEIFKTGSSWGTTTTYLEYTEQVE